MRARSAVGCNRLLGGIFHAGKITFLVIAPDNQPRGEVLFVRCAIGYSIVEGLQALAAYVDDREEIVPCAGGTIVEPVVPGLRC